MNILTYRINTPHQMKPRLHTNTHTLIHACGCPRAHQISEEKEHHRASIGGRGRHKPSNLTQAKALEQGAAAGRSEPSPPARARASDHPAVSPCRHRRKSGLPGKTGTREQRIIPTPAEFSNHVPAKFESWVGGEVAAIVAEEKCTRALCGRGAFRRRGCPADTVSVVAARG